MAILSTERAATRPTCTTPSKTLAERGEGGHEVVDQIRNSIADFDPLGASSALNDSVMIPLSGTSTGSRLAQPIEMIGRSERI
jgi:hypothetical protein